MKVFYLGTYFALSLQLAKTRSAVIEINIRESPKSIYREFVGHGVYERAMEASFESIFAPRE